ncbi:MAG: acylphosphatase [Candidatus Krumholzibacteria bacterium]|nr:acylphosphatase [Candidatus Krumholzibacteria bacterium]
MHIAVSGMVQGVGFRYFTRNLARSLNLTGFVRNTRDGRVEAEAQGDQAGIGAFINGVRTGPSGAMVSGVEVEDIAAEPGEEGFEVRF